MQFITSGLQADAGKFFLFMLGLFAQSLALSGIVYSVAAGVGVLSAGQIVLNMIILFFMVCFIPILAMHMYVCVQFYLHINKCNIDCTKC